VASAKARLERQRAFKARRCLIELPVARNAAEIAMRRAEVGLERQPPVEAGCAFAQSAFELSTVREPLCAPRGLD